MHGKRTLTPANAFAVARLAGLSLDVTPELARLVERARRRDHYDLDEKTTHAKPKGSTP